MAQRTGTASQVDGSAGNGSTSVTVPADATGAASFWGFWDGNASETLATMTLGANSFVVQSQIGDGTGSADAPGLGVAYLGTLPGTGTQTLAWTWSAGGARTEGGEIAVVWVKGVDGVSPVHDSDVAHWGDGVDLSVTINCDLTDLVLGFGVGYSAGLDVTGTEFIDSAGPIGSQFYDVSEITAASPTIDATISHQTFGGVSAISLKNAGAADTGLAWIRA
jgi:hypothetical protein